MIGNKAFKPKYVRQFSFSENNGQIHDQNFNIRNDVLFSGCLTNMNFHIRNNGISYQHKKASKNESALYLNGNKCMPENKSALEISRIDVDFVNSNICPTINHDTLLNTYNYYSANTPYGIKCNNYSGVSLKEIYPNINIHFYRSDNQLKYDFIIAPFTNYQQIKIKVKGAHPSIDKEGNLVLKGKFGSIIEKKPIAIQNDKILQTKWIIQKEIISFYVDAYDPKFQLIIDPVVVSREWSTYIGGAGLEESISCSNDKNNNIIIAGYTSMGSSNIATSGSYQTTYNGNLEAFLMKFNPNGNLIWGTYYGGSGSEKGFSTSIDNFGNIYLVGVTTSTGSISTSGSYQVNYGGGGSDVFLAKFNSSGVRQWCTYFGGTNDEAPNNCINDSNGNIYVSGNTKSNDLPIGTSGHQINYGGGNYDAFLIKIDSSGNFAWGTYYGDTLIDMSGRCAIDKYDNVYLCGSSSSISNTIISTPTSFQPNNAGSYDGFLVKFNALGMRIWGTYYGGSAADQITGCKIDKNGNIYICGTTTSAGGTNIASPSSHQPSIGFLGFSDAFIAKLDSNGFRIWGSYYGGYDQDEGEGCVVDKNNDVYLFGTTYSSVSTTIATFGSHQYSYGGSVDAFLVKFNTNGVRQWGTYYGGAGFESLLMCSIDTLGNIYGTGLCSTPGIAGTPGVFQPVIGGSWDGYLVKFKNCATPNAPTIITNPSQLTICSGNSTTLLAVGGGTVSWYTSPTGTIPIHIGSVFNTPTLTTNTTFYCEDLTCTTSDTRSNITITVIPSPSITITTSNLLICNGQNATLTATGANSYTWSNSSNANFTVISPTTTSIFNVIGLSINGCTNSATFTQSVSLCTLYDNLYNTPNNLIIVPNPVVNTLCLKSNSIPMVEADEIQIINSLGEIQLKLPFSNCIDLKNLNAGMYYIKVLKNSSVICFLRFSKM